MFAPLIALTCVVSQAPETPGPYTATSDLMASFALPSGTVDGHIYVPSNAPTPWVPVVVAHGFARSADELTGWGEHFASHGFIVAVPSFPNPLSPDHVANGTTIVELLAWLRTSAPMAANVDQTSGAIAGHSAGGLSAFLAAAQSPPGLSALIGLDPVDANGLAAAAAPMIGVPTAVLVAEPSACNSQGNSSTLWPGINTMGSWTARIVGSTHCDGENPSNRLCAIGCGGDNPNLRTLYQRYGTAHLLAAVRCEALGYVPGGASLAMDVSGGALADFAQIGSFPCGGAPDAGVRDGGNGTPRDGGDGAPRDGGSGTPRDGGDVVEPDAGAVDGGTTMGSDAGPTPADAGTPDSGTSAAKPGVQRDDGGCNCGTNSRRGAGGGLLMLVLLGLSVRRFGRSRA